MLYLRYTKCFESGRDYPLCVVSRRIVSPGFEPRSAGPEPTMMDHYTKRLAIEAKGLSFFN